MSSPQEVWNALISAGATPVQAAGIMGNIFFESGFNPESNSMDTNGYRSYGLVQWNAGSYPGASSLVTGNPARDLAAQVRYLAQLGGFRAASGSTASEAGANFAANFERCQGCEGGGSQNTKRAAQAAQFYAQAMTGNWQTAGGSLADAVAGATPNITAPDTCAWNLAAPSVSTPSSLGPIPLPNVTIGGQSFCVLSKVQVRDLVAVGLFMVSLAVGSLGVIALMAYGLKSTGVEEKVGTVVGLVPGGKAVKTAATASAAKTRKPRTPSKTTYSDSEFSNPKPESGKS